jgi:hypothetical protein
LAHYDVIRFVNEYVPCSSIILSFDVDLWIHTLYCRYHCGVLWFSTRSGQGIAGVRGVFDRIAACFGKHKIARGKVLSFRIGKFRHINSSAFSLKKELTVLVKAEVQGGPHAQLPPSRPSLLSPWQISLRPHRVAQRDSALLV